MIIVNIFIMIFDSSYLVSFYTSITSIIYFELQSKQILYEVFNYTSAIGKRQLWSLTALINSIDYIKIL